MKRITLKLIFSLFAITLFFSSCLGDGESSIERTDDFVFIGSSDLGQKYAATSLGRIASERINTLVLNKCYYMSYKITGSSNSSGIYNGENVDIGNSGYPIDAIDFVTGAPVQRQDSIVANNIGNIVFASDDYYGDNWLFKYNCSIKKGERVVAEYYYDKANQKELDLGVMKEIGAGKIIIDVRFRRISDETVSGNDVQQTLSSVTNLKGLKDSYYHTAISNQDAITETVNGRTYVFVPIKFRYFTPNSDNKKPDLLTTLGTFNIKGGVSNQVAYYFAYEK